MPVLASQRSSQVIKGLVLGISHSLIGPKDHIKEIRTTFYIPDSIFCYNPGRADDSSGETLVYRVRENRITRENRGGKDYYEMHPATDSALPW